MLLRIRPNAVVKNWWKHFAVLDSKAFNAWIVTLHSLQCWMKLKRSLNTELIYIDRSKVCSLPTEQLTKETLSSSFRLQGSNLEILATTLCFRGSKYLIQRPGYFGALQHLFLGLIRMSSCVGRSRWQQRVGQMCPTCWKGIQGHSINALHHILAYYYCPRKNWASTQQKGSVSRWDKSSNVLDLKVQS